ncbi:MAG: hypothetical protein IID16_00805 [Candidatus Marinimicrobia bacterium]|nr:hypothetical protein [Candidatus Neomarinimicrobiota bacterium]
MTPNFKEFEEFVNEKFGSITRFAKITTGSYHTYKGLQNLLESEDNYWKINALKKLAKKTDFDRGKVEVSGDERIAIKDRMAFIIATTDYESTFQWLKDNNIRHSLYSGIKGGRLKRKDSAFENLWKKLGL